MSLSGQNLTVVRRCCCCGGRRKFFTFPSSPPEPLGQFEPNLAQSILGEGDSSSNEGSRPFSMYSEMKELGPRTAK